jgi:hypothetical protein
VIAADFAETQVYATRETARRQPPRVVVGPRQPSAMTRKCLIYQAVTRYASTASARGEGVNPPSAVADAGVCPPKSAAQNSTRRKGR